MVFRFTHIACLVVCFIASVSSAADYAATEQLFFEGKYRECAEVAAEEVRKNVWNERWPQLLIRCQLTQGQYAEALDTYEKAIRQFSFGSVSMRMLGYEVYRSNSDRTKAEDELARIEGILRQNDLRFISNENLVAIGRYYVLSGEDAKKVLELIYDRVRASDPTFAEVYVATAELALSKFDYKVAADALAKAEKLRPNDPYIEYLSAQAWLASDAEQGQKHLHRALELNPHHVPSLLLVIDRLIDREEFDAAKHVLTDVLSVNLSQPEAWAYHAVIAHLQGHLEAEKVLHAIAQERWKENASVEHLIGRKLSQHYRFREGAAYQRRALQYDPEHIAAKFQLAQDLLRLGEEDAGWSLAEQVNKTDGYNVVAHNLMRLHDVISDYTTLERDGILVRMHQQEARIYGPAVLELLSEARKSLADKYQVSIDKPILVEIFPQQKDFAIRTFGLPGGEGFLGVCFGRVITANSPASQGATPANWQSVLWHEFCHVITLEKTHNKMPRWLSEGISVYEELQRDSTWGDSMSPAYRELILSEALTPVSELSSAFLNPKSPLHLQFAYFESAMVVKFIVEKHGFETLLKLLRDLGAGIPMNTALDRHTGSLAELDDQFSDYITEIAREYGKSADWNRDELPDDADTETLQAWIESHPKNIFGLQQYAEQLIRQKDYAAAKAPLEILRELLPYDVERNGTLRSLAEVYRELEDTKAEQTVLEEIFMHSSDAMPEFLRLSELALQKEDWQTVSKVTDRLLAINPLSAQTQSLASHAAEQQKHPLKTIAALQAQLELDPIDPAGIYYRLANAELEVGNTESARRHVLQALEDAPRYRAALELLQKIRDRTLKEKESDQQTTNSNE